MHGARGALRKVTVIVLGAWSAASADAADWSTKAEAGLVAARGNTHTDTANAKLDVARTSERWKNSAALSGVYAADEEGAITQRWDVRLQTEYTFDERSFSFASARYEDDRFGGFDYQATFAAGLGRRFIETERTKLNGQLGVGYKVIQREDTFSDDGLEFIPGEREEDVVGQGLVEFEHALTDNTRVRNKFLTEATSANTSLQNDLSLQVNMTEILALALGYSVRYNTQPPDGFKKRDMLSTVNLVLEIK